LFSISVLLLFAYRLHAKQLKHPLLRLGLLRLRTLRASVGGNFFTRLGAGGVPFFLPLLYQVGLGYIPTRLGLLLMLMPLVAMIFRFWLPQVLGYFGYRKLLLGNTILVGLTIASFSLISVGSSVWTIVLLASCFGTFASFHYTSMNTLAYSDVSDEDTS